MHDHKDKTAVSLGGQNKPLHPALHYTFKYYSKHCSFHGQTFQSYQSFTFTVDVPGLQEKYLINHPDVNKDYLDFSCEINVSDGTISYDKAIFEGCTRGSFCLHYAVYTF